MVCPVWRSVGCAAFCCGRVRKATPSAIRSGVRKRHVRERERGVVHSDEDVGVVERIAKDLVRPRYRKHGLRWVLWRS